MEPLESFSMNLPISFILKGSLMKDPIIEISLSSTSPSISFDLN